LVELDAGFDNPVLLVAAPDGGTDLIVEQPGAIVRADADHSVVVDISGDVRFEGEQGLLGLAIHPNFDENNNPHAELRTCDEKQRDLVQLHFQCKSWLYLHCPSIYQVISMFHASTCNPSSMETMYIRYIEQ
jgi:hypothetical protein